MSKKIMLLGGGLLAAAILTVSVGLPQASAKDEGKTVGGLELHVTSMGKMLVRGAKVIGISGNTINANVVWGSTTVNLTVLTDGNTHFIRRNGGASMLADISAGDEISVQGNLDTGVGTPFTVRAEAVKDWASKGSSSAGTRTTVQGTVKSTSPLVLAVKGVDYTIQASSTTSVLNTLWLKLPLGNIKTGDTVRVYGQINSDNTIDATVIRDISIR